jgi:hypothetical protein
MVNINDVVLLAAGFVFVTVFLPYIDRQPCRTSPLSGERYTQELLGCGNERKIQENLRMERSLFLKLCAILKVGSPGADTMQKIMN